MTGDSGIYRYVFRYIIGEDLRAERGEMLMVGWHLGRHICIWRKGEKERSGKGDEVRSLSASRKLNLARWTSWKLKRNTWDLVGSEDCLVSGLPTFFPSPLATVKRLFYKSFSLVRRTTLIWNCQPIMSTGCFPEPVATTLIRTRFDIREGCHDFFPLLIFAFLFDRVFSAEWWFRLYTINSAWKNFTLLRACTFIRLSTFFLDCRTSTKIEISNWKFGNLILVFLDFECGCFAQIWVLSRFPWGEYPVFLVSFDCWLIFFNF